MQDTEVARRRRPDVVDVATSNNVSSYSASSSSRGPWAQDEVHRLTHALSIFHDGQYHDIAKVIGTRSPQQVQMYLQKHRDALSKRQVGHRRRRSWEEGQPTNSAPPPMVPPTPPLHVTPPTAPPSSMANQRQRQSHPTYLHPPPSLARPTLPSPRHASSTPRNGTNRSVESMCDSVLNQFPGATYRDKLLNFYYRFNPSKVHEVDHILGLFRNRELRLFLNLSLKYKLSESMPQELITQRIRSLQRTPTPTGASSDAQDSNLRLLSSIVPPPQTFHDTRPFLPSPMALQQHHGHGGGSSVLPTLRPPLAALTPAATAVSTGRSLSAASWSANTTHAYHI
ncbi:hypothetical protein H310_05872 [Aphanomyces invadans]|uniref:HTH myb-type domain-containing protein n=1 Tax=Aphanomyces invadans TaxID=157072 RepID=A0A024U7Z8_9STRA|nr:hypothetical protein H310_05872 [Aphanomyces invadans]ETW02335.1 hypothetical protein H310_05872 [Aphanomyces invadans]|eukprot:XP_008868940.1 hypothetical protein H310_05872 [Aphanomyces invadans]